MAGAFRKSLLLFAPPTALALTSYVAAGAPQVPSGALDINEYRIQITGRSGETKNPDESPDFVQKLQVKLGSSLQDGVQVIKKAVEVALNKEDDKSAKVLVPGDLGVDFSSLSLFRSVSSEATDGSTTGEKAPQTKGGVKLLNEGVLAGPDQTVSSVFNKVLKLLEEISKTNDSSSRERHAFLAFKGYIQDLLQCWDDNREKFESAFWEGLVEFLSTEQKKRYSWEPECLDFVSHLLVEDSISVGGKTGDMLQLYVIEKALEEAHTGSDTNVLDQLSRLPSKIRCATEEQHGRKPFPGFFEFLIKEFLFAWAMPTDPLDTFDDEFKKARRSNLAEARAVAARFAETGPS